MHQFVQAVGYLNLVAFIGVALAAARVVQVRHGRPAYWALLAFVALAVVVLIGRILPQHPHGFGEHTAQRFEIAVFLLFPYLLYRFTTGFSPTSRRLDAGLTGLSIAMIAWTFALPGFRASDEPWPWWFVAYLVGFLVHWTLLSVISAGRLWRAGFGQPSVARRRMRMLAAASSVLTIALFLAVASSSPDSPVNAAAGLVAFASAVAFWLGLSPPGVVRLLWRRPEQERLRDAIEKLVTLSTSRAEVAGRVLAPMAAIVGARAIVIRDSERSIVGSVNVPADVLDDLAQGRPPRPLDRGELLELGIPGGSLVVWRPPFAPFFGDDEVNLLRTLGALTGIALDRVRLFEREREMRLALERADEVKSNFVALAAHELRTPATTIHGFVRTLTSVGDRIEEARREELQLELERQTLRLTRLVEQLLDLSRLDAEAIEISPRPFAVRERLEELVRAAAGERADTVEIHAPPHLEASADPDAFDRIVSNLLTNALRYGAPPILVGADRTDRHFRVYVEDRGRGVTPEFVPDLFERFARSEGSREKAQGTGLGLAIAQSYARAHGGALVYEPAEPHGARFQLVLPAA